jgi:hypothetical protein
LLDKLFEKKKKDRREDKHEAEVEDPRLVQTV